MAGKLRGRGGLRVQGRAWLEWHGQSLLGRGRLELLERLGQSGSISAAAREMSVSYRAAWRWIDEMNQAAGELLVETTTGGKGGGGARLTEVGQALLEGARLLNQRLGEFTEAMNQELDQVFREISTTASRRPRTLPAGRWRRGQ